jgi:hypothetical protein
MPCSIPLTRVRELFRLVRSYSELVAAVGSIEDKLVISVREADKDDNSGNKAKSSSNGKKRGRDTAEEDAERAVDRVRRCGADAECIPNASYAAAKETAAALLRLRGHDGVPVIESWAVSLRRRGEWGAARDAEHSLVVAARLSAGIAVPLAALCGALDACNDSMLSIGGASDGTDLDLPPSAASRAADAKTILVCAGVPRDERTCAGGDGAPRGRNG